MHNMGGAGASSCRFCDSPVQHAPLVCGIPKGTSPLHVLIGDDANNVEHLICFYCVANVERLDDVHLVRGTHCRHIDHQKQVT